MKLLRRAGRFGRTAGAAALAATRTALAPPRRATPSAVLERVVTQDVQLSGVSVPAGSTVILHYSANRDEALTDDPDRFDITRKPTPHMALGAGVHFCLGAPLARPELRAAFEGLLRRLPDLRPAVDTSEIEWKRGSSSGARSPYR